MAWNPHKFGSIEYDNWNYEHPGDVRDEVLAAKQTLQRANDFSDETNRAVAADTTPLPEEGNGFLTEQGSVFDSSLDKLARLGRQIVRPVPAAAEGAAGVGSLLPGPVGAASRLATGAMSGGRLLGGGAERLREHPVLSALDVGGVLAGGSALGGLKKATQLAPGLEEMANLLGGQALAHEGPQFVRRALDPMQRLASASASSPVEQLMEMPSFRNLPKGNVSKAKSAQVFNDAPKTPSVFQRMKAEGAFQGDRTTGHFEEGPGGLSSLAGLSKGKNVPSGTANSILNDMEGDWGHGLRPSPRKPWQEIALPAAEPLIPEMDRLAARSAERFGRRFRKE